MVCILGAMIIFITYNKKEMQARFFLKYAQIKKGAISFLLGVAIFVITYSSNEVGIISATGYILFKYSNPAVSVDFILLFLLRSTAENSGLINS